MDICAIVLAAGEGKRMRSKKSKLVTGRGSPVVCWVREALNSIGALEQVYVVGHMQDQVRAALGEDVAFVIQEQQLGTGHAVMQPRLFWKAGAAAHWCWWAMPR
jgi:bifunctional UDP-N-acetylglucosamine pyrophosphorylase/glucosamine-1-phosphate N-acetyltransferase